MGGKPKNIHQCVIIGKILSSKRVDVSRDLETSQQSRTQHQIKLDFHPFLSARELSLSFLDKNFERKR